MRTLAQGISPELLQALGWTLLHFVWQGAALAALFAVANTVCRRATPRYALAVVTLVLMMAVPVVTFTALMGREDPAVTDGARGASAIAVKPVEGVSVTARLSAPPPEIPTGQPMGILVCVEVWFLGVLRPLDLRLHDWRYRLRGPIKASDRIALVEIDDRTLSAFRDVWPLPRENYYLMVSAFAPYKRLDLAVKACNRLGRRLVIIGTGQDEQRIRAMAGPTVELLYSEYVPDFTSARVRTDLPAGTDQIVVLDSPLQVPAEDAARGGDQFRGRVRGSGTRSRRALRADAGTGGGGCAQSRPPTDRRREGPVSH